GSSNGFVQPDQTGSACEPHAPVNADVLPRASSTIRRATPRELERKSSRIPSCLLFLTGLCVMTHTQSNRMADQCHCKTFMSSIPRYLAPDLCRQNSGLPHGIATAAGNMAYPHRDDARTRLLPRRRSPPPA